MKCVRRTECEDGSAEGGVGGWEKKREEMQQMEEMHASLCRSDTSNTHRRLTCLFASQRHVADRTVLVATSPSSARHTHNTHLRTVT
eukprot:1573192-Rhodomonas_salina.2